MCSAYSVTPASKNCRHTAGTSPSTAGKGNATATFPRVHRKFCGFFYPNKMGNILLRSLKELLGRERMQLVMQEGGIADLLENPPPNNLKKTYPFRGVSGIIEGLETVFGTDGDQMETNQENGMANEEVRT